jgi:hypothetical protein
MLALAFAAVVCGAAAQNTTDAVDGGGGGESGAAMTGRLAGIVVLVCMSGLFSGLTLGILGLDTNQLLVSGVWHAVLAPPLW